jgi:hypothetical protein
MWITGQVTDHRGWVLPGVTVQATSVMHPNERVFITNARGEYAITGLAPGAYALTFCCPGFHSTSREILEARFVAIVNVRLSPGET